MKKLPIIILVLIVIGIIFWFSFLISQSNIQVFNPKGDIASQQRDLIYIAMGVMLSIAIPVVLTAFFIMWRYRDGGKGKHEPEKTGGRLTLFIFWLFFLELVLFFFYLVIRGSYSLDPHKEIIADVPPKTIQVVALDWKWLFIYPEENIAVVNFLQVPAKTPISFKLTADGPMNSFWIPQLGGQIYSMASMETSIHLMADEIGDFQGGAAEINGRGFAGMRFITRSSTEDDFEDWVKWVKLSGEPLTKSKYEELAKPSEDSPIIYYSEVEEGLYNNIMMKYMAPGESHGGGDE